MLFFKLILLLCIYFVNVCSGDHVCDMDWPRCGSIENIVCKNGGSCSPAPNSCCIPEPNDNIFRNWITDTHNYYRNRIAMGDEPHVGPVANMRTLHYDLDLEYTASCFANMCELHPNNCGRTQRFSQNGQNIEIIYGNKDMISISGIIQKWYSRIKYMKSDSYGSYMKNDTLSAPYTQMIWADTTHVGCAKASSCKRNFTILVCHYGPQGNIDEYPVFIAGKPASKCPIGSWGASEYPGLCGKVKRFNTNTNVVFQVKTRRTGGVEFFPIYDVILIGYIMYLLAD